MPRRGKGPRLYAQPERRSNSGKLLEHAVWVIRDRGGKISTGIPVEDAGRPPRDAEVALQAYLERKHVPERCGCYPINQIRVADVIAIYVRDKGTKHARPSEVFSRAEALNRYWGSKLLSDVNGASCRAFIEAGGTRRQLEDLRAAIKHHLNEGLHREIVSVVLPPKGPPRERWLTRSEAARLIWAAWRYRETQKGQGTRRASRQHVARFILVAVYTGTRAGAVCQAALSPTPGAGLIDLDSGIFYRRPEGERETKKRKTPVPIPPRLLAHIRRWKRLGLCRRFVVEWNGLPVKDVDKAFRNTVTAAGLDSSVTPHTLKHTSITWAMRNGMSKEDAARYFGTTVEVIERVYWHHHPDYLAHAAALMGRGPRQKSETGLERGRRSPASGTRA